MFAQLASYDTATLLLYVAIIFVAGGFACFSQSKPVVLTGQEVTCERKFRRVPFGISFAILAFFAATTAVGIDRKVYGQMFVDITWQTIGNGQEPGFNLFMLLVKLFTQEPAVFCGIMGVMTVGLAFKGFYDLRNDIYIGMAVFIYAAQYYFQGFNLMRIYFALSIALSGVSLLKRNQYFRYFLVLLVAFFIHYSMIFAMAAYVLGLIYIRLPRISLGIHATWSLGVIVIAFAGVFLLGDWIKTIDLPFIQKYVYYLDAIRFTSLGKMWIIQNLPILCLIYLAKNFKDTYHFRPMALSFMIGCLLIGTLNYSVPVIGRALIVLSFPYLVYYPYITEKYRKAMLLGKMDTSLSKVGTLYYKRDMQIMYLLLIGIAMVYFVGMTLLYFSGYMQSDGIDNFRFIWENYLW